MIFILLTVFLLVLGFAIKTSRSHKESKPTKLRHENIYWIFFLLICLEAFSMLVNYFQTSGFEVIGFLFIIPPILIGILMLYFRKWYSFIFLAIPYFITISNGYTTPETVILTKKILKISGYSEQMIFWEKGILILIITLGVLTFMDIVGSLRKIKNYSRTGKVAENMK